MEDDNPHPKPCFCARCAPAYNQTVLLCMAERLRLHGDNLQTLAERWDGFDRDALVKLAAALTDGSQVLLLIVARMRGTANGTTDHTTAK